MKRIVVIGGGAAGMMAAYGAAKEGAEVILLEKNEKTGKKIYITGKGRCNLTNACDAEDFFNNVVTNPKFMYSAFYGFDNNSVMELFEEEGCKLKVERGQRVFPESDKSSDVIQTLNRMLKKYKVDVHLNTTVTGISEGKVYSNRGSFDADSIIIATGGLSYPNTGSTGDGYKMAEDIGHTIVDTRASLVPLVTKEDTLSLQGLSLKNVKIRLISGKKKVYEGFGEMLFTHEGMSGPLVLSASCYYGKCKDDVHVEIDLKPALSSEELDNRILRDFDENKNKQFKNSLNKLLPQTIIPFVIQKTGIDADKKVNEITKEERRKLVATLKNLEFEIVANGGYNEAVITQGGINVKQIDPSTMESKLVENIYFAGEIIDVDAFTGGYNLQIAWSTGYLAGVSAALKGRE